MIVLYLLAAHLVGDFVLQTRWQAAGKFGFSSAEAFAFRARHVLAYCVPFVPIAIVYSPNAWQAAAFTSWLFLLHFATDTRRFRSTLGDVLSWTIDRHVAPAVAADTWISYLYGPGDNPLELGNRLEKARDITGRTLRFPPPNPWPTAPLAIDQTLHVCQIALLAGLFLS